MSHDWAAIFGDETERFLHMRKAIHDPQDKRAFEDGLLERKLADPKFRLEDLFPLGHLPAPSNEPPPLPEPPPAPAAVAKKVISETLETLSIHGSAKQKLPPRGDTELEKQLGEIIELGGHNAPLCLWPRRSEGA